MKFYVFNTSSDKVSVNYSLSLGSLNTEHTPSVKKKRWTGPVSDRSTRVDFEFYRSGRVEKILTGSGGATGRMGETSLLTSAQIHFRKPCKSVNFFLGLGRGQTESPSWFFLFLSLKYDKNFKKSLDKMSRKPRSNII